MLLEWGFLEADLDGRTAGFVAPASMPSLAKWHLMLAGHPRRTDDDMVEIASLLRSVAEIRNLLAHGLTSASAHPDQEPYVTCRSRQGDLRTIPLSEIRDARERLRRIRCSVRDVEL
jgi:hypothetical protein